VARKNGTALALLDPPLPAPEGRRPVDENRLLAGLPPQEYQRLLQFLELVPLTFREVLHEPDRPIRYVYFPRQGVVSMIQGMRPRSRIETATIGREGLVGLPLFWQGPSMSQRTMVQVAGTALRMKAEVFREEARWGKPLYDQLCRYTNAFFYQLAQAVACNALHSVKQRCCRWLLMTQDRIDSDDIPLTHEFLSLMLGVRRPSVTEVIRLLQRQGLTDHRRGVISIQDRRRLQAAACECYRMVGLEFERWLGS